MGNRKKKKKLVLGSNKELELSFLAGAYDKNTRPELADVRLGAQQFLEFSIGNIELNTLLRQDIMNGLGLSDEFRDDLSYFSYKTRNIDIDKAKELLDKMTKVQEAVKNGNPVNEKDRISLKEFAIISDLSKTTEFLDKLNGVGLLEGSKKLEQFHKNASLAKEIIGKLNTEVGASLATLGPGVIVFDDVKKSSTLKRKVLTFYEKIVNFFTKSKHTAILHSKKGEKGQDIPIRSEIYIGVNPNNYDVDLENHLAADTYKINLSALIPKEKHELLKETYGSDWMAQITTKYKLIEDDIHSSTGHARFGTLQASDEKDQRKAGLANLTPFGHKQIKANDFKEIHKKVMGNYDITQKTPTMLCSEFSGTTIIGALVELDKQIKKDIGKKAPSIAFTGELNKPIITIPFGKHEDLHKMHPSRLLDVLKSYKCVEPIVISASSNYIKEEARKIVKPAHKHIVQKPTTKKHESRTSPNQKQQEKSGRSK